MDYHQDFSLSFSRRRVEIRYAFTHFKKWNWNKAAFRLRSGSKSELKTLPNKEVYSLRNFQQLTLSLSTACPKGPCKVPNLLPFEKVPRIAHTGIRLSQASQFQEIWQCICLFRSTLVFQLWKMPDLSSTMKKREMMVMKCDWATSWFGNGVGARCQVYCCTITHVWYTARTQIRLVLFYTKSAALLESDAEQCYPVWWDRGWAEKRWFGQSSLSSGDS